MRCDADDDRFEAVDVMLNSIPEDTFLTGNICGVRYDPVRHILTVDTVISSTDTDEDNMVVGGLQQFANRFELDGKYKRKRDEIVLQDDTHSAHVCKWSEEPLTDIRDDRMPYVRYFVREAGIHAGNKLLTADRFVRWYLDAKCFEPRLASFALARWYPVGLRYLVKQVRTVARCCIVRNEHVGLMGFYKFTIVNRSNISDNVACVYRVTPKVKQITSL